jgi:pyridinium-3,5-bisthiocarboxylic acid mononucleotide nickel chelatase
MNKRILYFDCFSGISGDMTIGSLLDLGIDRNEFLMEISKINIDGYEIEIKNSKKNGISGVRFNVLITNRHKSESINNDACHGHSHQKRNFKDIIGIIENSGLSEKIKELSMKIFTIIAEAEAKIHANNIEDVHFHEVGAIDSIIDIIGTAICIDLLKIDEIFSSPVNLGGGVIHCEHGLYPVPAPATLEILKGVPVYSNWVSDELTTPTGSAIIKSLCSEYSNFPKFCVEKIGYGIGSKNLKIPNVLRVIQGVSE